MIITFTFAVTFAILGSYLAIISLFGKGWKKTPPFLAEENVSSAKTVSVVVACKNEESHLPHLLRALHKQSLRDFQLILVNDHSTDRTAEIMEDAKLHFENIRIIKSDSPGKKAALRCGISAATGALIITTDADCTPPVKWIETVLAFQKKENCDLIIAPVKMQENNNLFSKIQSLEFSTLVASSAGAAGNSMPIMCNGANLAYTKQAWTENNDKLFENEISGDDIFLLLSIKKRGGKIRFLKSENAMVITKPATTLAEFLRQRKRWTSKSKSYTDVQIILVAFVILLTALSQIGLLIAGLFWVKLWVAAAAFFLIKYLTDLIFLWTVNDLFKTKKLLSRSFILSLYYPFYIGYTALSGLLNGAKNWK